MSGVHFKRYLLIYFNPKLIFCSNVVYAKTTEARPGRPNQEKVTTKSIVINSVCNFNVKTIIV